MIEAPARIWMDPDIKFPECEKQYACDVEYIRADLVEAAVKRALEGAAECCDVVAMDGIGDIVRAKGDEIRQLDPAQFIDGEK